MVEKFKEKFKALIEDYKVTRNENEDFKIFFRPYEWQGKLLGDYKRSRENL